MEKVSAFSRAPSELLHGDFAKGRSPVYLGLNRRSLETSRSHHLQEARNVTAAQRGTCEGRRPLFSTTGQTSLLLLHHLQANRLLEMLAWRSRGDSPRPRSRNAQTGRSFAIFGSEAPPLAVRARVPSRAPSRKAQPASADGGDRRVISRCAAPAARPPRGGSLRISLRSPSACASRAAASCRLLALLTLARTRTTIVRLRASPHSHIRCLLHR